MPDVLLYFNWIANPAGWSSSRISNVSTGRAALIGLHRAWLVRGLRYLVRCPYFKVPSVEASTSQGVETVKVA